MDLVNAIVTAIFSVQLDNVFYIYQRLVNDGFEKLQLCSRQGSSPIGSSEYANKTLTVNLGKIGTPQILLRY